MGRIVNMARPARRPRDPEATRAALIEAAADVFAERGFHAAPLEDIVARAGYTRGAFYSNFSSKEDLFIAVVEDRQRGRIAGTDEVASTADSPQGFNRDQRAHTTTIAPEERKRWVLLMMEFWLHAARTPGLHEHAARLKAHQRQATARQLEELKTSAGLDLPGSTELIAAALVALDDGFALQEVLDPDHVPQTTLWDAVDLLTEAITVLAATDRPSP